MPSITNSNVITDTGQILDGIIVNADINASAAIAASKLTGVALLGANSDITSLSGLTTPLTVAQGGVGVATLGDAGVLIGNGTGAVQVTSAGTAGQLLTSNGAGVDPTFQTLAADWNQVGQTVLGAAASSITVSSLPARKHYRFYFRTTSMGDQAWLRINGDTGANYSYRTSANGGADAVATAATKIIFDQISGNGRISAEGDFSVIGTENVVINGHMNSLGTSAAAPGRTDFCGAWQGGAAPTSITILTAGGGNMNTGSILTVYASKD